MYEEGREVVTHVLLLARCYEDAANKVAYVCYYIFIKLVFMPVVSFYLPTVARRKHVRLTGRHGDVNL